MAVSEVTRAELESLDALGTVEGQVALRLAEQLDMPRNGMAVAGDAKALTALMTVIRELKPLEADSVDDSRGEAERILRSVG